MESVEVSLDSGQAKVGYDWSVIDQDSIAGSEESETSVSVVIVIVIHGLCDGVCDIIKIANLPALCTLLTISCTDWAGH